MLSTTGASATSVISLMVGHHQRERRRELRLQIPRRQLCPFSQVFTRRHFACTRSARNGISYHRRRFRVFSHWRKLDSFDAFHHAPARERPNPPQRAVGGAAAAAAAGGAPDGRGARRVPPSERAAHRLQQPAAVIGDGRTRRGDCVSKRSPMWPAMAEWSRLTATDRGSGQPEARSGAGRGLWSARWPEAELSRLVPNTGGDGAGRAVLHAAGAAGGRPPPALVRAQGARAHPRAAPVPHLRAGGLT